jgi:hypothetical protein
MDVEIVLHQNYFRGVEEVVVGQVLECMSVMGPPLARRPEVVGGVEVQSPSTDIAESRVFPASRTSTY